MSVEQFDILLTPPGIDRGGNYNRPTASIVLDVRDGAVMLVGDDGHRRGPFKPGHIQDRVETNALLNAGQADAELRGYFKAIDRERGDPKSPDLASTRMASLMELVEQGLSAPQALDYWAVEEQGYSQGQWGGQRGRSQQAISENVMKAKEKIGGLDE